MKHHQGFKRVMSLLIAAILLIWMIPSANVSAAISSGEGYTFDSDTGLLTITSDNGMTNYMNDGNITTSNVKKLDIQSPCSYIYFANFQNFSSLESVKMCSNVSVIDTFAFVDCFHLKYLIFDGQTPPDVFPNAFDNCPALTVFVPSGCSSGYTNYLGNSLPQGSTITEQSTHVDELYLDRGSIVFQSIGEETTIQATVTPDFAWDKSISWSIDDTSVATVDSSGKVTAVGPGMTLLTARTNDMDRTLFVDITVLQQDAVQIDIQPQNAGMSTYGYTSFDVPTISVTASKTASAQAGSVISYQWYRVKTQGESEDVAVGTNSSSLTMPLGLSYGNYEFYCVVSCDDTTLKTNSFLFMVVKAAPTITITDYSMPAVCGQNFHMAVAVSGVHGEALSGQLVLREQSTGLQWVLTNQGMGLFDIPAYYAGFRYFSVEFIPDLYGDSLNYIIEDSFPEMYYFEKGDQLPLNIIPVTGLRYNDGNFSLHTTGGSGTGEVTYSVPSNNGVLSLNGNEASIIGVGTVRITATKAADVNYNSTQTYYDLTVSKDEPVIELMNNYDLDYLFSGYPLSIPAEDDMYLDGLSYSDLTFTWYTDSVNPQNILSEAPSDPGTYVLVADFAGNANYSASSLPMTITIRYDDGPVSVRYNGSPTLSSWYKDDVGITADGYLISDNVYGPFTSTYTFDGEGTITTILYFMNIETGGISSGQPFTINIDRTAPAFSGPFDGIMIGGTHYSNLLSQITYERKYKDGYSVDTRATDYGSGVMMYYYYFDESGSTTAKTKQELDALSFVSGPAAFGMVEPGKCVIYAYVVDDAGNRSDYICTDGFVIDQTAPILKLTEPSGSNLADITATYKVQMDEPGTIYYQCSKSAPTGLTAEYLVDSLVSNEIPVSDADINTDLDMSIDGLQPNTMYYLIVASVDQVGNVSLLHSSTFTTTKTMPLFDGAPSLSGVYGQEVKDMSVQQTASTNGVAGTWSADSTVVPSVGTQTEYSVTFHPTDADRYATVTVMLVPSVSPKSLLSEDVRIGNVTDSLVYTGSAQEPTVEISDSQTDIFASDYAFGYSDNTDAGTATLTITGTGNYTGSVQRSFEIAKATAPSIDFPSASAITYGQALSDSALTGGSTEYGSFAWMNPEDVPEGISGSASFDVVFTPYSQISKNYDIASFAQGVDVTVNKAVPTLTTDVSVLGPVGGRSAIVTVEIEDVQTGSIPTGTVKFYDCSGASPVELGSAALVSGTASFTWNGLSERIYKVKAEYTGDLNYSSVTGGTQEFDVRLKLTGIEAYVYGLYKTALGREPDLNGFKSWIDQIQKSQMTGTQVAYGFFFSTEISRRNLSDKEFITLLYRALFQREPDAKGLENWLSAMNSGVSRKYVFAGLVQSKEWALQCEKIGIAQGTYASDEGRDKNLNITAFVSRLYSVCLERKADVAGLNDWTNLLYQKKTTGTNVAQSIIFSQELLAKNLSNTNYVDLLYRGLLGRNADAAGKAFWIAQLTAGRSRMDVFRGFASSQEFANLCVKYGVERGSV